MPATQTGGLIKTEKGYEVSYYGEGQITKENWLKCSAKISLAFKNIEKGFLEILKEQLFKAKFTDERMIDAVTYVIQNCIYAQPTIAQFLTFDSREKLYTYDQMLEYVHQHGTTTEKFQIVEVGGRKLWRLK